MSHARTKDHRVIARAPKKHANEEPILADAGGRIVGAKVECVFGSKPTSSGSTLAMQMGMFG